MTITRTNDAFVLVVLLLIAVATSGCLEQEDIVLGPGGFQGSADGAGTPAQDTQASCNKDEACSDGKVCTVDRCVEGVCSNETAEGAPCEDGDKCTTGETCAGGSCKGGAPLACDDGSDCTADQCNPASGSCVYPTIEGTCDDGNPCTTGDHCGNGKCAATGLKSCEDGNPCTGGTCQPTATKDLPAGGCQFVALKAPCDDGNACTDKDSCKQGQCGGDTKACDDGNACTIDACKPKTGCDHPAKSGPCDDGNKCTTADACDDTGGCAGKPLAADHCDDGNPCTADVCSGQKGCVHSFNSEPCDDGNPCTKNDKCALGICYKGAKDPKCACNSNQECQAFDKNLCDGLLICNLATQSCELDPTTIVPCKSGPCTKATCTPSTGVCSQSKFPNGAACDADSDKCTAGDVCNSGACVAGGKADCDDNNPCTKDLCAAKDGCLHLAADGPCDDGNKCTTGDSCNAKACQAGLHKSCDDKNLCTKDSCNAKTAACLHNGGPMNGDACDADGSLCTVADACKDGTCVKGKKLSCDDQNPCTTDACNPAGGKGCQHAPNAAACDDGNPCTLKDSCDFAKCQPGNSKSCVDGDKCTTDSCDSATGKCTHKAVAGCSTKCTKSAECDDKNACTDDTCDGGVCSNKNRVGACSDGTVCTTGDACKGGLCQGKTKVCDDANACTDESCDAKSGCASKAAAGPCDADANACTIGDACKAGGCVAGGVKKCFDGKACTVDTCDPKTGSCGFDAKSLEGKPCDADGSVCTHADSCKSGACLPGNKLDCDDNNACTADSCVAGAGKSGTSGCNHAAVADACDDGDKCTAVGKCIAGSCVHGETKVCDDDNACTANACEKASGSCAFTPINSCANACKSKADCDDKNPCTNDTCELGKCKHASRTGECSDSNKCYLAGTCQGGVCSGAKKALCNDNNECTTDTCDGAKGSCDFAGNTDPCDDLNPCTVADHCSFATCTPGDSKSCDDKNKCTADKCDTKTGKCVFTDNALGCDDGDKCTLNDACANGTCAAGTSGVQTLTAGGNGTGQTDGAKGKAKFNYPKGIWIDAKGEAYIAGGSNDLIRKVAKDGTVSTFAGLGAAGYSNGPRLKALFSNPQGVVGDKQGNLYIADTDNHVVRIIDTNGIANNFAGDGKAGMTDGYGAKARMHLPASIAIDGAGLYVTDAGNHTVMAITLDGLVYTMAGSGKAGFKDDVGTAAQFDIPMGVAAAKDGSVYVGDAANHRIRRISQTGVVTTIAGTGTQGVTNGAANAAKFVFPQGLHLLDNGALLIADRQNHLIRQMHNGKVTTVYGDGLIKTLYEPLELASDGESNIWVVDSKNHRIVRFSLPAKVCDDGNSCTTSACDSKTGKCSYQGKANGAKCGNGCFDGQFCKDTKCQFGTPKNCNDYNGCTNDYCSAGVCKSVPVFGCK